MMSAINNKCHFLLKGEPGIGKTTLVSKIVEKLKQLNLPVKGFITLEIRDSTRKRIGFDIKSVTDSSSVPLARVETDDKLTQPKCTVGKYTVYPENLDKFALLFIKDFEDIRGIIIIDEIGKMESFSKHLFKQISELFLNSNSIIIATCNAVGRPLPLVESITVNPKCNIIKVNQSNRNNLVADIAEQIKINLNQH